MQLRIATELGALARDGGKLEALSRAKNLEVGHLRAALSESYVEACAELLELDALCLNWMRTSTRDPGPRAR